jgi:hypothetical protein
LKTYVNIKIHRDVSTLKKRLLCRYAAVKKEDFCRLAALTYSELYWLACELG